MLIFLLLLLLLCSLSKITTNNALVKKIMIRNQAEDGLKNIYAKITSLKKSNSLLQSVFLSAFPPLTIKISRIIKAHKLSH